MEKYVLLVIAYLIGSIPFSYILGKWIKGEDIRKKGSGNLGTTNAFRVLGKAIGIAVLLLDTLKSGLLVALMLYTDWFSEFDLFPPLFYGFISIVGHIYPVWFCFKGGKGVASSLGLLLAYDPFVGFVVIAVFLITEFLTRYVSVASTVASLVAVITVLIRHLFFESDWIFLIITIAAVALILIRHRQNYIRLKHKNENRIKLFDWYDRINEKAKEKRHSE